MKNDKDSKRKLPPEMIRYVDCLVAYIESNEGKKYWEQDDNIKFISIGCGHIIYGEHRYQDKQDFVNTFPYSLIQSCAVPLNVIKSNYIFFLLYN